MSELKMFENQQFGKLRTMIIDGEIWFVGKDVAECLGYSKARNAIASHVMNEDKKDAPIQGHLEGKLFIHNLLVSDGFRVIEEVA